MREETKNIESWGHSAIVQTHDAIAKAELTQNQRNQAWWETLPMTYDDWNTSERDPITQEDFERVDRFYFGTNPYIEETLDFSKFKGKKLFEIGCGAGSASCRFSMEGADVTAIDLTQKAVELTQRHIAVKGLQKVKTIQGDAEDLSFLQDESFDYLYAWGVMHHSSNPEQCFAQACLKLKPGGQGLIMVYHQTSVRFWLKGLYYLFAKGKVFKGDDLVSVQRYFTDGYYHKHYTRTSLREALEGAGYQVDKIDVTHMSSRLIPGIPEFVRQWIKRRFGWLIVAHITKPQR